MSDIKVGDRVVVTSVGPHGAAAYIEGESGVVTGGPATHFGVDGSYTVRLDGDTCDIFCTEVEKVASASDVEKRLAAVEARVKELADRATAGAVQTFRVGETVAVSDLDALPVGAKFRDRDEDEWTKIEDGFSLWGSRWEQEEGPETFAPLVITSLPDAEPEPSPTPAQVPTQVKISTVVRDGGDVTVEPSCYGGGGAFILVCEGERSGSGAIWLTREETRSLAASLTAIANAGDSPF